MSFDAALGEIHDPAVLKTVSGGYDGHGQLVLRSDADLEKIRSRSDRGGGFPPSMLEGFVDFAFEVFDSGLRQRQGLRHLPDCA